MAALGAGGRRNVLTSGASPVARQPARPELPLPTCILSACLGWAFVAGVDVAVGEGGEAMLAGRDSGLRKGHGRSNLGGQKAPGQRHPRWAVADYWSGWQEHDECARYSQDSMAGW